MDKARRVRHPQKPKPQSAQIGPDGPKHPGNRQLYDKRGRPDAGAWLLADYPKLKVATFCAALWLTFTLPLTGGEETQFCGVDMTGVRAVSMELHTRIYGGQGIRNTFQAMHDQDFFYHQKASCADVVLFERLDDTRT